MKVGDKIEATLCGRPKRTYTVRYLSKYEALLEDDDKLLALVARIGLVPTPDPKELLRHAKDAIDKRHLGTAKMLLTKLEGMI